MDTKAHVFAYCFSLFRFPVFSVYSVIVFRFSRVLRFCFFFGANFVLISQGPSLVKGSLMEALLFCVSFVLFLLWFLASLWLVPWPVG